MASCHGPSIAEHQVPAALDLLREVPDAATPPQPEQLLLDEIVAGMSAAIA